MLIAAAAKSLQSCLTLCDPIEGSPPGSPVPGILQARTLGWVAISFSNAWKWKVKVKVKSCPTLHDHMDCSLPASSAHGIFQARLLEWVAIAFSIGVPILKFGSYFRIFLMWINFKVFIEFVTILLLFYVLVFWPWGMGDLSSLTRDQTKMPHVGKQSRNYWITREVMAVAFKIDIL